MQKSIIIREDYFDSLRPKSKFHTETNLSRDLKTADCSDTQSRKDNSADKKSASIKDYELSKYCLGKGAYGKVLLAKNKRTSGVFAVKIIEKKFLEEQRKTYEVHIEKYMLMHLHHKYIVKLFSTFQDKRRLYFVLEYLPNRDLADLIRAQRIFFILIELDVFSYEVARFFSAQIVVALEYLQSQKIIHRDLKVKDG